MPGSDDALADYYEILGVPHDVDWFTLQDAYDRLASSYKRELAGDQAAMHEAFTRLNEAYRVLGNPQQRAAYDEAHGIERPPRAVSAAGPQWEPRPLAVTAQPEHGRRWWRGFLAIGLGLLAALSVLGVWGFIEWKHATNGADQATERFLHAMATTAYDQAYGLVCPEMRSVTTFDEFLAASSAASELFEGYKKHEMVSSLLMVQSDGPRTVNYQAVITYRDGSSGQLDATLSEEDGQWCIDGMDIQR